MPHRIRFALIAVACALLLSSSAYLVTRPARADNRPHPPFEPGVQPIPDLTLRYKKLREAHAHQDSAAAEAVLADIVHFRDAALPPIEGELARLESPGAALDAIDEALLADLFSALWRIDTSSSRAALVHHAAEAARGRVRGGLLAQVFLAMPANSHGLAVQALLAALRAEPDDDAARSLIEALQTIARFDDLSAIEQAKEGLPAARRDALEAIADAVSRKALPEALAGASVPAATRMARAEAVLFSGAMAPPEGKVPPSAKPILEEASTAQPELAPPAGIQQSRIAVVHWLESQGTGDTAQQAIQMLERTASQPPNATDNKGVPPAAAAALARMAGRGSDDAGKALARLFDSGDANRRATLAAQLVIYATASTSPMLSRWLEDPALPSDLVARARKVLNALASTHPR